MFLAKVAVEGFRASVPGPLICDIPGRFSVLLGANGTGKSTATDAIALAHADVFPWKPRATTASLAKTGQRSIETSYEYENAETIRIWKERRAQGVPAPKWNRRLYSAMGVVRSEIVDTTSETRDVFRNLPMLYLPATRNPIEDLAGRNARLIVEMLRTQAKRRGEPASLSGLKKHLGNLIATILSSHALLADAESRVHESLGQLTQGVSGKAAFLATRSTKRSSRAFLSSSLATLFRIEVLRIGSNSKVWATPTSFR